MRVAEIAMHALFDDTKQLVADGVRADVASCINSAESDQEREAAKARGEERLGFLRGWLADDRPLSYGASKPVQTYPTLLQAVVAKEEDIIHGLPRMTQNAMSHADLADKLIEMSRPHFAKTPTAPVLSKGSFLPLLKLAYRRIVALSPAGDSDTQTTFLRNIIEASLRQLSISFFPFHKPLDGGRGSPLRVPVFNYWSQLGRPGQGSSRSALSTPQAAPSSQRAADIALQAALASDCNSEWSVEHITLANVHTILNKTSLPLDYTIPAGSSAQYVNETYRWVKDNYDGTKRLHHLALIVSIFASSLLPNLFTPAEDHDAIRARFAHASSEEEAREIYEDIPWVKRQDKGMKDRRIHVAMLTTSIIALYEESSPLRRHMKGSLKKGLGDPWTSKHSAPLLPLICCSASHPVSLSC